MTASRDMKIGGLLLAAGASNRLGRPKQLLSFGDSTLLRHAAEALTRSACEPVVVVLGANVESCRDEIRDLNVSVCVNRAWQAGMSSSIKAGLSQLLLVEPALNAVMITVCDQPYVTSAHIDLFTTEFQTLQSPIIAAAYSGTLGVPALFSRDMFDSLLNVTGDKGARDIIRGHRGVVPIRFEEGAFDVDTVEDAGTLSLP